MSSLVSEPNPAAAKRNHQTQNRKRNVEKADKHSRGHGKDNVMNCAIALVVQSVSCPYNVVVTTSYYDCFIPASVAVRGTFHTGFKCITVNIYEYVLRVDYSNEFTRYCRETCAMSAVARIRTEEHVDTPCEEERDSIF